MQSAAGEKLTAEALNEALKVDPAGVICIKSVSVSVSVRCVSVSVSVSVNE